MRSLFGGLRTAWLMLGMMLIFGMLLEGSLRAVRHFKRASDRDDLASRAGFQNAPWARDYVDELSLAVRAKWQPYVQWRAAPLAGQFIHVDSDGLRRTVPPPSAPAPAIPDERPLVWVFGGSVVWGWGARDEHTIASDLQAALLALGHPVKVVNYGQIGYVTTQEVLALCGELRSGGKPAVAVFVDGYNDLMAAVQEGAAGLPQNEEHRRAEFNVGLGGALAIEVRRSATLWLVKGLLERGGVSQDARQSYRASSGPTLAELGQQIVRTYAENVRFVEAVRADRGFAALYYWQPVAFGKKHLVGDEGSAAKSWPALAELLGHVRAGFATASPLDKVPFRDLTTLFDDSDQAIFIDACHFSEPGNRVVAQEIARDVARLLPAPSAAP